MKMQSIKLFVAAIAIAILSAASVSAQGVVKFDIPFQFHIGKEKLDAGKYEIKQMTGSRYLFRNTKTGASRLVVSIAESGTNESSVAEKLVFNRYGNVYFMRQLFVKNGTAGRELGESSAERRLRKVSNSNDDRLAKRVSNLETIALTASKN
jgi:hypothetical protein